MIIDFHTHIYPDHLAEKALSSIKDAPGVIPGSDGTEKGLLQAMDRCGVDLSVILTMAGNPAKTRNVNLWSLGRNSDRLLAVGSFHPDEPDPIGMLHQIKDWGMKGVKVHPEYQNFTFDEERLYPFWECCMELGLFLVTHAGADYYFKPPYKTDPKRLREFHLRFPELVFVLGHFGSLDMWDEVEEQIIGLPVYLDTSLMPRRLSPEQGARMIRNHGADRVVFGTDSPWGDAAEGIAYINSLDLTEAEKKAVLGGSAAKLLKLSSDS